MHEKKMTRYSAHLIIVKKVNFNPRARQQVKCKCNIFSKALFSVRPHASKIRAQKRSIRACFSNFAPKKRAQHNSAARTRKRLLMPPIGGFHAPRAGFSGIPPTRFILPRNLKNNRAVKKMRESVD